MPMTDDDLAVMQVTRNLEIGGAQETARTLAKYLPRLGCSTVVCAFGDGPLRPEIEKLGVPVELLPDRQHSIVAFPLFVREMIRRRRDLLNLAAKHRTDVIQTQGLGTLDFLIATLGIGRTIQVWWTIQNQNFMLREEHLPRYKWLLGPKIAVHRWLYRAGARIVRGIIAVSDETALSFRDAVRHVGNKITVVPNAVDIEFYPSPSDRDAVRAQLGFGPADHMMTMVGTFKHQKGHRHLIEATAQVAPSFPQLHVVLVGGGELTRAIKEQVKGAGLADRIHFLGSRRDVPELLAASDSFVLPSLWEGLPVALVEAMASELPIIATAVSGTSQVVIDRVTGLLVPPADTTALALAMTELLSDPARAALMAAAGRERVDASFSALAQAEKLAALFRSEASARGDGKWEPRMVVRS
jgi:glycosyltransferase involved in cell wall biosynthesis